MSKGYIPISIIMDFIIMACRSRGKDSIQVRGGFHVDCLECLHLIRETSENTAICQCFCTYKRYVQDAIYLVVECINEFYVTAALK